MCRRLAGEGSFVPMAGPIAAKKNRGNGPERPSLASFNSPPNISHAQRTAVKNLPRAERSIVGAFISCRKDQTLTETSHLRSCKNERVPFAFSISSSGTPKSYRMNSAFQASVIASSSSLIFCPTVTHRRTISVNEIGSAGSLRRQLAADSRSRRKDEPLYLTSKRLKLSNLGSDRVSASTRSHSPALYLNSTRGGGVGPLTARLSTSRKWRSRHSRSRRA